MRFFKLTCMVFAFSWASNAISYEILGVFPLSAKSHFIVFDSLMMELANRANNVTVVSSFPKNRFIPHYREIDVKNCFPPFGSLPIAETLKYADPVACTKMILARNPPYEQILSCQPLVQLFNFSGNYDLLIMETFHNDFYQLLGQKLGISVVAFHSNVPFPWMMRWTGLPLNPSYIPYFLTSYLPKMTFFQRLINSILYVYSIIAYRISSDFVYEGMAFKFFGNSLPSLTDVRKNTSLLLLYTNLNLNYIIPLEPNTIEVGGLNIKKPKSLPNVCTNF